MPRIPTPAELGWVQPTAMRQIATVDASGLARGIEGFGNALTDVADKRAEQSRVVGIAQAEAYKTDQTMALDRQLQQSNDFQQIPGQARQGSEQIVKQAARYIANPIDRERWLAVNQNDVARFSQKAATDASNKERSAQVTALNDSLRQMGSVYSDPNTADDLRETQMKNIAGTIDMAEKTGLIDAGTASKARSLYVVSSKEQYLENLAKSGGKLPDIGIERKTPTGAPAFSPDVDKAIVEASRATGVDENALRVYAKIESGGKPGDQTGSYKGLFQLSDSEFARHGSGNIFDARDNAIAAANKLKAEAASFKAKTGRDPTPADLYMVHQQGEAGYAAHLANPDAPAWQNMASTGEGRQKGDAWARAAIWGNVPDQMKAKFGSVDNITSRDFVQMWTDRVNSGKFGDGPVVDPKFADVPYEKRLAAQQIYDNTIKARMAEQVAAQRVVQSQTKEAYALGIQTDNASITPAVILNDSRLDSGDKTALLKEYEAREKHSGLARQMAAADADGSSIPLNRFDPDVRKGADKYADTLVKGGMSPIDAADRIQQRFGVVPSKTVSMLNGVRTGTDVNAAAQAGRIAYNMMMRNPNAFDGDDGGSALSKFAIAYAHNTQDLGYSPEKAAALAQAADDPNQRAKVKITDEEAKAFQKEITTASSITSLVGSKLDVSWWPGNPTIGQNDDVRKAMLSDFAQVALQNVRDGMTKDQAKAEAAVQLGRIWGVTKLQGTAMNGTVMKYPPEKRYPQAPDAKGDVGYGYILEQAADWVKQQAGHDVVPGSVGLVHVVDGRSGTLTTAAAWDANQPLPYTLTYQYKDKDGYTRTGVVDKPFVADPTRAMRAQVSKADAANIQARRAVEARDAAFAAQDAVRTAPPKPVTAADIPGDNIPDEEKQIRADEMNRRNQADYDVAARMKADKGIDMSAAGLRARQDRLKADAAETAKTAAAVNEAGNEADAIRMDEAVKASRGGVSMSQAEFEKRKARLTEQEKAARRAVLKGGDK